jgi:hypothetical protein
LLLGELAGQWVDCSSEAFNRFSERIVWFLTRPLRDRRQTPLTRFAGLLYHCLDEKAVTAADFNLAAWRNAYTGLADYPGGAEIAYTFETMAVFLAGDSLADVAVAGRGGRPAGLTVAAPLRPTVLIALARLTEIGGEVAAYRAATGRVSQLAALARAAAGLNDLDGYVATEVVPPEQYILRRIIQQWQQGVIAAGGQVGRAVEVGPVANPYVAGNPVLGDLFVGRQDILRQLEELWAPGAKQCPSVVLYGHRRMGKTSILRNLGGRFGPHTVMVDFNMQRVGPVAHTGELLYNLALALYDAQTSEVLKTSEVFSEPDETAFTAHNPYTAFNRFLKRFDQARAGRRFIITVDEFELVEQMITEGRLEGGLLDFWRSLIQTYPWFIMALAGLHTLQEMTQDYWHPLFGSVTAIPVSFLDPAAARQLIVQPSPDFSLNYDADAVERIISLTAGQPYLTQHIGHGLVTRFNRQNFEEGTARERRFTLADVEAVVAAADFYRDGNAYFTGVWQQAKQDAPGQQVTLTALAPGPATAAQLAAATGLSPEQSLAALNTLRRHDVVHSGPLSPEERAAAPNSNEANLSPQAPWAFTVELMRRWVAQRNHEK